MYVQLKTLQLIPYGCVGPEQTCFRQRPWAMSWGPVAHVIHSEPFSYCHISYHAHEAPAPEVTNLINPSKERPNLMVLPSQPIPLLINAEPASLPPPCFHSSVFSDLGRLASSPPLHHQRALTHPIRGHLTASCRMAERLPKVGCLLMYFVKLRSLRKQWASPFDKCILQMV